MMNTKPAFFRKPNHFHILSTSLSCVVGSLNNGLDGMGTVGVFASKRGLRIALNGVTLARGKTPNELAENFEAAVARAKRQ